MPSPGDSGVPNGIFFGASGRDNMSASEIRELLNGARLDAISRASRTVPPVVAQVDQFRRSLENLGAAVGRVFVPGLKVGEADPGSFTPPGPRPESSLDLYARQMEEQNRQIDEELALQREAIQSGRPLRVPRPERIQTPQPAGVAKVSPLSVSPAPPPNFGPVKRRIFLPEE